MISPARKLCYRILQRIETQGLFSDDALNSRGMDGLEVRDRHLTTEIVYGTLRWRDLLDYVLAKSSARPWVDVSPGAKTLLRMSLYQMWHMDRIPHHALVNDAVELAKRELGKSIGGYLNGVLRNIARTNPWKDNKFIESAPRWVQVSLPKWLWQRWTSRYGDDVAGEYACALNVAPRAALRFIEMPGNVALLPFEFIPSDLVPDAFIQTASMRTDVGATEDSIRCHFQDEASQLIPHLLGFRAPGSRIWDACAAPGGKTAILEKLCGDSGRVISSDVRIERASRLRTLLRDSGALKADVLVADAGKSPPFRGCFDGVLADVPCSGLGTLRRNPEIKWRFNPDKLVSLQRTQMQILHSVAEAVRPGGRLLYSTCSTEPEENEAVVEDFLDSHPDFKLERPQYPPGIDAWIGRDQMVRTFPATRLWDGFFAALMVRHR